MIILNKKKLIKLNSGKSIISFTKNIIDYAGLFPPAKLNMTDALQNYIQYRTGDYNFMLSRFICPVKLLPEFEILSRNFHSDQKLIYISVISSGGNSGEDFKINLEEDLKLLTEFISNNEGRVKISSVEAKLPDGLIKKNNSKEIASFINSLAAKIKKEISEPLFIFLEAGLSEDWKSNLKSLIERVGIHNLNNFNSGFKLRTGGIEASAFPSSELIAFCIRECLDRKVPMKFTAGLHHPFRHYDIEIGTMMHGFINVFGAGIIAMRHNISNYGIEEILNDENPGNFIFTDDYFSWKDWKIEIADIEYARNDLVLSFGSCSFDEPVNDLKSLNLI